MIRKVERAGRQLIVQSRRDGAGGIVIKLSRQAGDSTEIVLTNREIGALLEFLGDFSPGYSPHHFATRVPGTNPGDTADAMAVRDHLERARTALCGQPAQAITLSDVEGAVQSLIDAVEGLT